MYNVSMNSKQNWLVAKAFAWPCVMMTVGCVYYIVVSMHYLRLAYYDHFSPLLTEVTLCLSIIVALWLDVSLVRRMISSGLLARRAIRVAVPTATAICVVLSVVAVRQIRIDAKNTDLLFAAEHGDMAVLNRLLDGGVGIDVRNDTGMTPLMRAAEFGKTDTVATLLNRGANKDAQDGLGSTAIEVAADQGQSQAIALLSHHGADVNIADREGLTPVMWAAAFTNNDAIDTLIRCGAKVNLQDKRGKTALMMAAGDKDELQSCGSARTLSILLAAGANTQLQDHNGSTALAIALKANRADLAAVLSQNNQQQNPVTGIPQSTEFRSVANLP